jgi:aspartate 1-decarboxylase
MCLNGAAARKGSVGDDVIIISYFHLTDEEAKNYQPTILLLNEKNQIIKKTHSTEPNTIFSRD